MKQPYRTTMTCLKCHKDNHANFGPYWNVCEVCDFILHIYCEGNRNEDILDTEEYNSHKQCNSAVDVI